MENKDKYYLIIIAILTLSLIFFNGNHKDPIPINHYNYNTDTLFHKKQYKTLFTEFQEIKKDLDKLKKTPPKTINYYNTPNPETVVVEKIPDSLIVYIQDLEKRLSISDKYIKNYPENDKLIDFKLNRDNLDIATLTIKGETKKQNYPLYLDTYNYFWDKNQIFREKRKTPYIYPKPNKWKNLYFSVGYEPFLKSPNLGLDYSVELGRFRLQTESDMILLSNEPFTFNFNIGYRLLK